MVFKSYRCPLFGAQVTFVFNCSFEEYVAIIRKRICVDFDNECTGQAGQFSRFKTASGHRFWTLWINDKDKNAQIAMTHETLHVAEDILDCYGIEPRGEIIAYYQGFWLEKFTKVFHVEQKDKS